jgi:type 2A phosphatase activator TIP41
MGIPGEEPKSLSVVPSKRRHIHPNLEVHGGRVVHNSFQGTDSSEQAVAGISIRGWTIVTSQGPIGDSHWFDQTTVDLQRISQPRHTTRGDTTDASDTIKRRQLALPEMVFPLAQVVLDYEYHPPDGDAASPQNHHVSLSINANDFLQEWAEAHQDIALPDNQQQQQQHPQYHLDDHVPDPSTPPPVLVSSSMGVSILETSDATLWKKKNDNRSDENNSSVAPFIGSTTFHYDWTYSSPYCGTLSTSTDKNNDNWQSLEKSGMPMHLLTDTRVPILLFDQIVLVEDDLHDNGQVQFSAKIRVMPTCAYILTQLFVRVDQVLIRVREGRWLIEFGKGADADHDHHHCPGRIKIYRDVTWRECPWNRLATHRLPTNIQAWTQNESWQPQDAATFAQLLQQVPKVALPPTIPAHSQFVL